MTDKEVTSLQSILNTTEHVASDHTLIYMHAESSRTQSSKFTKLIRPRMSLTILLIIIT